MLVMNAFVLARRQCQPHEDQTLECGPGRRGVESGSVWRWRSALSASSQANYYLCPSPQSKTAASMCRLLRPPPPAGSALIRNGAALAESAALSELGVRDGDTLLLGSARPRANAAREAEAEASENSVRGVTDGDEAAALTVPEDSRGRAYRLLRSHIGLPEWAVFLLLSVKPAVWAAWVVWFALFRAIALRVGSPLTEVYVLCSLIAGIFVVGLGTRREGEQSAYSVFNEGFEELPGTFNAQMVENMLRHRA